jgi:putative acetyltransferase
MINISRANSNNSQFKELIILLDKELTGRYGELQKMYRKQNIIEKIQPVVLAFVDDKIAGCGCFREMDATAAEIKRMFVKKEFRGTGISKLLLNELESWACEKGYKTLLLETGIKQPEAINLYAKAGFHKIENYGEYADMANSLCMQKDIFTAQS